MDNKIVNPKFKIWRIKNSFHKIVKNRIPENIIYFIDKVGIKDPNNCICDVNIIQDNPFSRYLHYNHRKINRDFWEIIFVFDLKLFSILRQVLENDVDNHIVSKDYARQLIDNFFWSDPFKVEWI